jgi:glycosyltransferase involved in cell wall biosynthesis
VTRLRTRAKSTMISFIVPAFNEEQNITAAVGTIRAAADNSALGGYEIILIDDGSNDGTYAAMAAMAKTNPSITVLRNEQNLGIGTSIRRGIAAARNPRFMIVPGDNDMGNAFIMLLLAFRDQADLILTVPLNKEQRTLSRNIISMFYQMIQMATFGVYVGYINGPGIWPTEKARAVGLESERFSIISEMNVKLLRSGCSYAELPGYFQSGPKTRSTVTFANLREVIRLYLSLVYKVYVSHRKDFNRWPTRVQIDFASVMQHGGQPD